MQLKCLLRYAESGMPVTNQNVLRIWTDSHDKKPSIKLYKGQLSIKARVEDVSKNHHLPRGPFYLLEQRHCLAEIVERGVGVPKERPRVIFPHPEREIIVISGNAPHRRYCFVHQ